MRTAAFVTSAVMLLVSVGGFAVSFPMWLSRSVKDRTIFGITFVLSWAALWYSALTNLLVLMLADN